MRKFVWLIFLLGSLFACIPQLSGSNIDCNKDGALFVDNFDGEQDCGWVVYNENGVTVQINNGVLTLSNSQTGQVGWTNPNKNFGDVIITTKARQVSGPDNNAYGVICRYQDVENFYLFLISGDGYYAIVKYQSGVNEAIPLLGDTTFLPSDAINQGVATNQIRASCIGNQLSLAVNGIPLATVTDPTFVIGDVGMGASIFQPGVITVAFDDFQVIQP